MAGINHLLCLISVFRALRRLVQDRRGHLPAIPPTRDHFHDEDHQGRSVADDQDQKSSRKLSKFQRSPSRLHCDAFLVVVEQTPVRHLII